MFKLIVFLANIGVKLIVLLANRGVKFIVLLANRGVKLIWEYLEVPNVISILQIRNNRKFIK